MILREIALESIYQEKSRSIKVIFQGGESLNRHLYSENYGIKLLYAENADRRLIYDMVFEDDEMWATMLPSREDFPWSVLRDEEPHFFGAEAGDSKYLLIKYDNKIIGAVAHTYNDGKIPNMELSAWLRASKYAGKGVGTNAIKLLIESLIKDYGIKTFIIRPWIKNTRAVKAYEKCGFVVTDSFNPEDYYGKYLELAAQGDFGEDGTANMVLSIEALNSGKGENVNNEILVELKERGADIIRFVGLADMPKERTLGLDKAILFCTALSMEYIQKTLRNDFQIDYDNDEYLRKEEQIENLADWLSYYLREKGYNAHSQSAKNNKKCGYIESAYIDPDVQEGISILPQKSIARIAGLGFIGKNNLFITKEYGCAFVMCSVLTDAPLITENHSIVQSSCGACDACVNACPANALLGNEWTINGGRENVVDVSKCCCPLRCMFSCPWTLKYANAE